MAREGNAQDIAQCHALHRSARFPYEASPRVLQEMWRGLVADGRMLLFLVEDRSRPPGSRIVSFSATVFVTDRFCFEAQSMLPPYLGVQLSQRYFSGALPVLNDRQVARANAGEGLNVMLCFDGWQRSALSRDQILALREKQNEAFQFTHGGYHLKEFIAEPIGEQALHWMVDSGARLRRDYAEYFQNKGMRVPEPSRRPWLVGLTKEEAFANPGSHLCGFFVYTPPRFHFSRSEQALLRHAMMGKTCKELATSLFISPWTVKKRWRAVYERVADVDSELLLPVGNDVDAATRGTEHRRHLLHYLRQHLEELRPFAR
jgi:DNA-binding CsgD family transcriptional regulator